MPNQIMNILIDIGHPAHVHLFRNFAHIMIGRGHRVLFTCRDKEFEIELLKANGFEYVSFGKKYKSTVGKIYGMFKFDYLEWKECGRFKPDILLSHGSIYAAHAAAIIRKPHIAFDDTYNMEQIRLYEPFSNVLLTADYDHPKISNKEIHYAGYHELAYLHPNYFKPDPSVLEELGVEKGEKYVLFRFVAWNASHDVGHKGISYDIKMKAVERLSKYARVFISSESKLPSELENYRLTTRPERIFDVLAYSSLVWGESFTIPAEASILGIPSVINHNTKSYYLYDQQDRYGLCFCYSESAEDQERALRKCEELLQMDKNELRNEWKNKREKLLQSKIDVTAFLTWFIENYPESITIMKENPDYQYRFGNQPVVKAVPLTGGVFLSSSIAA